MPVPNILTNIGNTATKVLDAILPASRASYTATPTVLPPTPRLPASVPGATSVPVPSDWKTALTDAYSRYSQVPKGMIESIMMMESNMGQNKANAKNDFGTYGYLAGHTKSGALVDTLNKAKADPNLAKNYKILQKTPTGQYQIYGIDNLATPYATIQATASVLAQQMANHPEHTDPSDIYFKYYNANPKVDTPARRNQFTSHFNYYSQ